MSGTPGRPLSAELSDQLLSVAVDILAEEGWSKFNSDRVAARARAGKAGIYRRWPTMSALARSAVARLPLITPPPDTGSLRGDLTALVERWRRPLSREERAAAGLVSAARHDEELRAGLEAAVVRPLAAAVAVIGERAAGRGDAVPAQRLALLRSVLEAFWWQRYTSSTGPMTPEQTHRVVEEVLLPLVTPTVHAAAV